MTWLIVLPTNFLIDSLAVYLTLKFVKAEDVRNIYKKTILKVWGFGFLADFIGTILMFIPNLIHFDSNTEFRDWWYKNMANAVSYNPFDSIYAVIWVTLSVLITAFFIYLFNLKVSFRKIDLEESIKKKLALSLAVFTSPYLFYMPTKWFF